VAKARVEAKVKAKAIALDIVASAVGGEVAVVEIESPPSSTIGKQCDM
jgi:hypothetical protein